MDLIEHDVSLVLSPAFLSLSQAITPPACPKSPLCLPPPALSPQILCVEQPRMVSLVEPSLRLMHSPRTQKFFLESLKFVNEVDCLLESPNSISKCESDSTGAVWFIHDKFGDPFAVFKPSDSEAGSEAGSKPARQGVLPGEGALHEFSVSFLSGNSTKVPLTCLVQINHPAVGQTPSFGSLQKYVPHQCQSWDMGPSAFSENDVHSVGVLDIRFLNTDRHGGNMLVSNQAGLIPIDHTYCLPHSLDETWYEWLQWPQAKKTFFFL
mmetsp:Transcript_26795/g.37329  ORF Transcript_26795/g.37329 Transcript_26795/m.37329 type:complete len:266 (+) Transcript_26795:243-1040(+)